MKKNGKNDSSNSNNEDEKFRFSLCSQAYSFLFKFCLGWNKYDELSINMVQLWWLCLPRLFGYLKKIKWAKKANE